MSLEAAASSSVVSASLGISSESSR